MYAFRNSGLTKEQLTNLGVTGKDVPNAAPTMLFPPLISRPMEIEKNNNALDYKVMWKEEFRIHLYDVHSKSELNLTDDSYSSKVAVSLFHNLNLKFSKLISIVECTGEGTQEENTVQVRMESNAVWTEAIQ